MSHSVTTMTVMAERVPPSDETAAVNAGETVAVPNATPTDAVELAWSSGDGFAVSEEPADDPKEPAPATVYQSWGTTVRNAVLLLVVGLGVAGLIFWAVGCSRRRNPRRLISLPRPRRRPRRRRRRHPDR